MRFVPTPLPGAWTIEIDVLRDQRGHFARVYCEREFAAHGLVSRFVQANLSGNLRRGTLRGLHYQAAPHEEARVVRCTQGAVYDVMVDLRRESPTYLRWHAVELSRANGRAAYVPSGFAHGFQTLEDDTELLYLMSEFFVPEAGRGLHWADPVLAVAWPLPDPVVSERDRAHPLIDPAGRPS